MKRLTIASIPAMLLMTGLTAGAFAQTQTPQTPATPPQTTPAQEAPTQAAPSQTSPASPAHTRAHAHNGKSASHGMPEHVEERINAMHKRLQITAEQEPAWNAFAQVMRDNATKTAQAYQDRAAHLQTMTAVENLQSFAQLEQTRAQGVQSLATSFDTLYGQLSDNQKHVADAMFARQGEHAAAHKEHHHK
ncbi:MAG TPA: Spy/CpxP family protein refolding chaperone [Rhodopila sp.]|nr:Spy/CpxP family protein refolding chaperone [Rhodopila sp.]